jgi:hypothetical protein
MKLWIPRRSLGRRLIGSSHTLVAIRRDPFNQLMDLQNVYVGCHGGCYRAKVEKKDREETLRELFQRIKGAKILKENKSIKSAAKKLLKKKKIKKLSCHFSKK